jgi:hypothetical protein
VTTLLEMAQSIAEETGFTSPSAVIGSSEETYKRLKRALDKGGELTAREHNWSILQKEYTFSTVASQEEYDLTSLGVRHILGGTAWNRTDYWQMRGSLSPRQWQVRKSGLGNQVGLRNRYRVFLGANSKTIKIDPVPGGVEDLVVEYVTDYWIASATKNKFTLDTDEPDIDPFLIELAGLWCFQRAEGLAYADSYAEWKMQVDRAWMRDGIPEEVCFANDPVMAERMPLANTPDSGIGL